VESSIPNDAIHTSQVAGRRLDIQLTGKHLAVLFMTAAVVSAVIFLSGVVFGRTQHRAASIPADSSAAVKTTAQAVVAPPAREVEVTGLPSPPADIHSDQIGTMSPSSEQVEPGASKPDTPPHRRRGTGHHRTRSHAASHRARSAPTGQ
jgi:hypothetical protein